MIPLPHPTSTSVLNYALAYADAGLEIMPRLGKYKLIDALKGQTRTGLKGREVVAAYWAEFPATHALAVVCGRHSGVLVVDLDRGHADGADGIATWQAWEAKHGPVTAPFVITPSGGRHLYFRMPGLRLRNGKMGDGVELLGERMAATLPPSQKAAGTYRWSLSRHPTWLPIPDPPEWLMAMARPKPRNFTRLSKREFGDRSRYVAAAMDSIVAELAGTVTNRNQALFRAAARCMDFVRDGQLAEHDVEAALTPAAISTGLNEREIRTTLESAERLIR